MKEEALKKVSQTHENVIAQLTSEKTKTQQQLQFIKKLQRKLLLISKVSFISFVILTSHKVNIHYSCPLS